MQRGTDSVRTNYVRPVALATIFVGAGEAMVFVVWALLLHPDGNHLAKLLLAAVCAIGMGVASGLLAGFIVRGRCEGAVAAGVAALCYATVLAAGIFISYEIDIALDLFGVDDDPELFVLTGILPALLSAPLYGWLLHSRLGRKLLRLAGI